LPVIGVPIKSKSLNGLDSLLSMVQMPSGVPVATVAIDGAANAGLLALRILGVSDRAINDKIMAYQKKLRDQVVHAKV
jgi:5-(carboxyamino)imidazole ribonucleotide mutase